MPLRTKGLRRSLIFDPPDIGCVLRMSGRPQGGPVIFDDSPYGNHGTIVGATPVRLPSGLWGLGFDGDDYVDCGAFTQGKFTSENFSIGMWIYPLALVGDKGFITHGADAASGYYYRMQFADASRLEFVTCQAGATQVNYSAVNTLVLNTWKRYWVVRSGANLLFYANAVNVTASAVAIVDPVAATTNLLIGCYTVGVAHANFRKALLDIRLNKALSAAEIADDFAKTKHLFNV